MGISVQFTAGKFLALTNTGAPAVGYKVWAYLSPDTSTPASSYSDFECSSANTWPVVLNARGEAAIYVNTATDFYLTIPTATDISSPIWESRKVGSEQQNYVTGSATPTTLDNNYIVTTTPAVTALSNNLTLVMTPDVDNTATIGTVTFTGTGTNDLTASGAYIGSVSGVDFTFEIDSLGTPDTFQWKKGGGSWHTGVAITGAAQNIVEGLVVTFATTTGHTLNDIWAIPVTTPARVNLDTLGNLIVYKNRGGSVVPLDGGDMKAGYPAQMILNAGLDAWLLMNPATPTFSTPTITAIRYRKNITNTYNLLLADQGYELSCIGTFTINLLTPPQFANRFFYIKNVGTGTITVDAGSPYVIKGTGQQTYRLGPGFGIQLVTNGVDWHIIADVGGYQLSQVALPSTATDITFSNLTPGVRYQLVVEVDVTAAGYIYLQFNGDTAGYSSVYGEFGSGDAIETQGPSSSIALMTASDGSFVFSVIDFVTFLSDSHKVQVLSRTGYQNSGSYTAVGTGRYFGSADVTSVTVLAAASMTGMVCLYVVG